MQLESYNRIYFLGIGGIGMSALARYFLAQGKDIAGCDRVSTPLTRELEKEGMTIHYTDDIEQIPDSFKEINHTLVIYTPAIPKTHKEFMYFTRQNHLIKKRSEVLGLLSKEMYGIAVAGTHGKTTVSTLIAYLLNFTQEKCNAFLGGIAKDFNSNLLIATQSDKMVLEADEYDRSFLQLYPNLTVITAMDADHLDIYGDKEELEKTFHTFIDQIKPGGFLLYKTGLPICRPEKTAVYTYALSGEADFHTSNVKIVNGGFEFSVVTLTGVVEGFRLEIPGRINVENALAALSVCYLLGYDLADFKTPLQHFKGIYRRFDVQLQQPQIVYIDDYAHHPAELEAVISSVKELYPDKKISGIFQPHLYTRTRDFADGFAASLDKLDEIVLLDIYPAREPPIKGITSKLIFNKIRNRKKYICAKNELLKLLDSMDVEVLLTMGAGDIDQLVQPIKVLLEKKHMARV